MSVQVGDSVTLRCEIEGINHGMREATVIYVHPQMRFCVVEFEFDFGVFRNTVYLGNRSRPGRERAPRKETET